MRSVRVFMRVFVLGLLLPSFPALARAQACCLLPQAADQPAQETEAKPLPQTAAPAPDEGGVLRGMMAWCMKMMRHDMPSLTTAQPAPPQQETLQE